MDFFNKLKESFSNVKEITKGRLFNAGEKGQVINGPILYSWFWTTKLGKPRGIDYIELRQYEKNAYVQMVLNSITKHASTIEWNLTNEDEEDQTDYSEAINEVENLLKFPNRNGDTFWQIFGPFLRDVLTLDAGTIYKAKSNGGKLKELFVHDGSRFLFKIDKYGVIEGYYQYSFLSPSSKPKFFGVEEIIYGQMNRNTENYPYGFSPLQSIQQEVEVMIQSTRYNKEFFKRNAIPDGIVSVPMRGEEMDAFKAGWKTELAGKPHKLLFHNSEASFTPLNNNNRDMEWLAGQEWYFHTVFGAYGLSPQEVGFYDKSSRATGESQERITVRNAIKPYLSMITDKINREIIPEITDAPIKFSFLITDDISEKIQHEQAMDKLDRNVYTINEIRAKEGLDPVEWGDEPPTKASPMSDSEETDDSSNGNFTDPDDKKEDREKKSKNSFINKENVLPGPEQKAEANNYYSFLDKTFKSWQNKVMIQFDKQISPEIETKSLNNLLILILETLAVKNLYDGLKKVIKTTMNQGLESAESELGVDVGFPTTVDMKVNIEVSKQINGFTIEGKKWDGLKGVTMDLTDDIRTAVTIGLAENKSLVDIKNDVNNVFVKMIGTPESEGRIMKIARTETTRIQNEAKLEAFNNSGLEGFKVWDAFLDNRTSPICERLNGQKVRLNEMFVDPVTGKEFMHPGAHVNCRSVIRWEPSD